MKKALATGLLVFTLHFANAQTFTSSERTKCEVQVAFAISEADGFGEYSITELVPLKPGETHNYRGDDFVARQIYGRVDYDEMFIVRFEPTGQTHFLDATIPNGYETFLNGGCSFDQRPFYTRDGEFIIDASAN